MYKSSIQIFIWLVLFSLILISCSELDKTDDIFPSSSDASPVINSVSPDSAFNGVMEITINGQNFSPDASKNFVYFGSAESQVLSATTTELVVLRPISVGGLFNIKTVVQNAFLFAEIPNYRLEPGILSLRDGETYNSIAVGKGDSLFAESDDVVYLITASGERVEYGTVDFTSSEMRVAPDGYLYIQRRENRNLYRIAPGGGASEQLTRVRRNASVFDFDSEGYIYSGGERSGFSVTTPDAGTSTEYDLYDGNYRITALRIFDGYVYVAADTLLDEDEEGFFRSIYRHELLGSGEMGDQELFFNWSEQAGAYSLSVINDITFSEEGTLYVATNNSNPILIINQDFSIQTLYADNINGPLFQIAWGTGKYLYVNRVGAEDSDSGLARLVMGKEGAPYFGRM